MKKNKRLFLIFGLIFFSILSCVLPQDQKSKIAVTIDDLPLQRIDHFENNKLRKIFDKLVKNIKSQRIPIIGFVNEMKLQVKGEYDIRRIVLLKKWINAGLDLGNHTFSHPSLHDLSIEKFEEEILKGEKITRELLNQNKKELKYFRHPYLQTGRSLEAKNTIEQFLSDHKYTVAPVTIDNADWIFASAYDKAIDSNKTEVMKQIGTEYINYMKSKIEYWQGQSIALFGRNINHVLLIHANTLNAEYFPELCKMIRSMNYKFVSLDEALHDEAYKSNDTFIGNGGISWIHRWAITQGKKKDFFGEEPQVPKFIMRYSGINSE
ncbi:MAG: polysaccharide deacetylase [Melioribacter sp.]|nr:polysaccharide deacetylase [Melioribacter sp.]